jgi:GxxExxY protein
MANLVEGEVTFRIIGAAMEVHRVLGPGFLEAAYQRGMEVELRQRGMEFEAQRRVPVTYKGYTLGDHVLDLIVDRKVIVELKAVKKLTTHHQAQLISYLKAAGLPVGLLFNFSKLHLEKRRILLKESLWRPPFNPFNPL